MASPKIMDFTRYEIARIIGARALQIAMDAPLLIDISEGELTDLKYDAIKIAEKEFGSGVLPISVKRPLPRTKREKLRVIKEDRVDDQKIIEKEQEIEKEIKEKAGEMGFVNNNDDDLSDENGNGDDE